MYRRVILRETAWVLGIASVMLAGGALVANLPSDPPRPPLPVGTETTSSLGGTATTVAGFSFRTDPQSSQLVWDGGIVFVRQTSGPEKGKVSVHTVRAGSVVLTGLDQVEVVWNPSLPDDLVVLTSGSWLDSDDNIVLMVTWNRIGGLDITLGDPDDDQGDPT